MFLQSETPNRALRKAIKDRLATGQIKNDEDVLIFIIGYMRGSVFPSCKDRNVERMTDEFVNKRRGGKSIESQDSSIKIPLISLDEFVKEGVGVCRHHGLALSYFIDRLTKEKFL